jgi:tetratricopeptide (TPR) repeat protein
MGAGDASFLIDRIDAVAMSEPAMKDPAVAEAERAEVAEQASSISRAYGLGILKGMGAGGRYRLLRAAKLGGRPAAIFRTVSESGSFDYHGWIVEPDGQADFKLVDVHLFVLGENMSAMIREVVRKTTGASPSEAARCPRVSLLLKLRAARDADDQAGAAAILDEVEKLPADDPAKGSILLDRLIAKKRFAEAKAALEEIDRRVLGDPYLWALRGNILFLEGKSELAKSEIGRAVTADPSLEEGYLALIGISLKERRFKDTARWLTAMRDVAGAEILNMETLPEYAEFVRSPEYAKLSDQATREEECDRLIHVLNSEEGHIRRQVHEIEKAPANAAAYREAAARAEAAVTTASQVALSSRKLAAFAAEFQGVLRKSARAFSDAASAIDAGQAGRAEEIMKGWKATMETDMSALAVRVNGFCQQ